MIPYTLVRSRRRKTIAIHITQDAIVEVRTPMNTSREEIDQAVNTHRQWIEKNLALCKEQVEHKGAFSLDYGNPLLLQGIEYPIERRQGNQAGFDGQCFYLPPGLSSEQIRQIIVQIYRKQAKRILQERVAQYANVMGCVPTSVGITGAKTRWGSCSRRGRINFSWYLIMADSAEIDYVVIHELAHLIEHNHSPRFWALVARQIPDYRERREKLKGLQGRLSRENWDLP